jgi:archaellum biogenesis protein FlaJ (TadC family)
MYSVMPRIYKKKLKELMIFSGSKTREPAFCNNSFAVSILAGFVPAILLRMLWLWPVISVSLFALFHGFLILAVDKRTKFVETILPDALQIMAANIRSGFIPSRAILLSARKEFGPLSEGIKNMGKEMLTGRSFQDSLDELTKTVKSEILERTVILLKKGTMAGGQLVSLFDETAQDMRRRETISKEVKANILMYAIFIGFAACAGAPLLYGLSTYLVTTIAKMGSVMDVPTDYTSKLPLMKFGLDISPDFLIWFSIAAILITTVFGGMLIGIINTGKEKSGIKYIPIMLAISMTVFFVTRIAVAGVFNSIIPG